jgi:hypothetical protein
LERVRRRKAEQKQNAILEQELEKERVIENCTQLIIEFLGARVETCDWPCFFAELHRWVNTLGTGNLIRPTPTEFPKDA